MTTSINAKARIAGILYLIIIIAGIFSMLLIRERMVVAGDPEATAANIIQHNLTWRIGIAADMLMQLLDIPVMWIIFLVLRPVNKDLALLGLLFNLIQTAVLAANKIILVGSLLPLENLPYLRAVDPSILHTQAYLAIKLHEIGFGVGLLFFGLTLLVNGYLVYRSRFLPKAIGIMLQVAGACYLVCNLLLLLSPTLNHALFPYLMLPCFIAELSYALWLTFKGVEEGKWKEADVHLRA